MSIEHVRTRLHFGENGALSHLPAIKVNIDKVSAEIGSLVLNSGVDSYLIILFRQVAPWFWGNLPRKVVEKIPVLLTSEATFPKLSLVAEKERGPRLIQARKKYAYRKAAKEQVETEQICKLKKKEMMQILRLKMTNMKQKSNF